MASRLHFHALACLAISGTASPLLAGEPPAAVPPPTPGPAQRAGAEVDRAMERLKVWLDRAEVSGKEAASDAHAAAKRWLERTTRDLLGDPNAEIVHGMQMARRLSEQTRADGEVVVHFEWTPVEPLLEARENGTGKKLPARVVLMLHGLDEPGTGWDDLTPHLLRAGYDVIWFDYPNDGPIAKSADLVGEGLKRLHAAGVERIDIVGHSMGGLVGRDLLTRTEWYAGDGKGNDALPAVRRLIIMSAPNHGSVLAPLQPIAEAREQISRAMDDTQNPGAGLINSFADGAGEAATDLAPGSKFLTDLNARPLPKNVAITNIIAILLPEDEQKALVKQAGDLAAWMGVEPSSQVEHLIARLGTCIGDGLVSAKSAELEGVTDTVRVRADHRSMVRAWHILPEPVSPPAPALTPPEQTPAVPVILERLARE